MECNKEDIQAIYGKFYAENDIKSINNLVDGLTFLSKRLNDQLNNNLDNNYTCDITKQIYCSKKELEHIEHLANVVEIILKEINESSN